MNKHIKRANFLYARLLGLVVDKIKNNFVWTNWSLLVWAKIIIWEWIIFWSLCPAEADNREKLRNYWCNSRCGSASLCPWERHLMLLLILGPGNLPVVVAQLTKYMQQNRSILEWTRSITFVKKPLFWK